MKELLILSAFLVISGLANAKPNSETDHNKIHEDLRNLLSSVNKNDLKKAENYRHILEEEAVREQRAFDTMKRDLRLARHRNSKTGEKATALKREAPPKNDGSGLADTSASPSVESEPKSSKQHSKVPNAIGESPALETAKLTEARSRKRRTVSRKKVGRPQKTTRASSSKKKKGGKLKTMKEGKSKTKTKSGKADYASEEKDYKLMKMEGDEDIWRKVTERTSTTVDDYEWDSEDDWDKVLKKAEVNKRLFDFDSTDDSDDSRSYEAASEERTTTKLATVSRKAVTRSRKIASKSSSKKTTGETSKAKKSATTANRPDSAEDVHSKSTVTEMVGDVVTSQKATTVDDAYETNDWFSDLKRAAVKMKYFNSESDEDNEVSQENSTTKPEPTTQHAESETEMMGDKVTSQEVTTQHAESETEMTGDKVMSQKATAADDSKYETNDWFSELKRAAVKMKYFNSESDEDNKVSQEKSTTKLEPTTQHVESKTTSSTRSSDPTKTTMAAKPSKSTSKSQKKSKSQTSSTAETTHTTPEPELRGFEDSASVVEDDAPSTVDFDEQDPDDYSMTYTSLDDRDSGAAETAGDDDDVGDESDYGSYDEHGNAEDEGDLTSDSAEYDESVEDDKASPGGPRPKSVQKLPAKGAVKRRMKLKKQKQWIKAEKREKKKEKEKRKQSSLTGMNKKRASKRRRTGADQSRASKLGIRRMMSGRHFGRNAGKEVFWRNGRKVYRGPRARVPLRGKAKLNAKIYKQG